MSPGNLARFDPPMVGAQVPEATQRMRIQVSWLLAYPPLFVKTGSIFDMIREYTEYIHQFENALTRKLSIYLKPNLWFRQNRYSTNSHQSLVRIPSPTNHQFTEFLDLNWVPTNNIYLKPKTLEPYLLSSIFFHLDLLDILCTIFSFCFISILNVLLKSGELFGVMPPRGVIS